MSYNPMGPQNLFPPYFFDPNFQNALLKGQPFPYNVLNQPPFDGEVKITTYPKYGLLPYDIYSKHPKEPSQAELEKEYKEIMKSQQKKPSDKKQEKQPKPKEKKKPKQSAMISFDQLTAGTIQSSSGIFNGKNIQFGWSAHSKTNNGFGTVGGNSNTLRNNINVVFDNDQLDTPIDDRDIMWSPVPTT